MVRNNAEIVAVVVAITAVVGMSGCRIDGQYSQAQPQGFATNAPGFSQPQPVSEQSPLETAKLIMCSPFFLLSGDLP